MRMWDLDDTRGLSSSLVLEQDFVLRIRRLHRLGTAQLVALITLSTIPEDYEGFGSIDDAQRRLQALVVAQKGSFANMTNGDVFLIWPASAMSKVFPQQALMVTLPQGASDNDFENYVTLYNLPEDYTALREKADDYINAQRDTLIKKDPKEEPADILLSGNLRGPLTANSVDLIEKLFQDIDLSPFIRSQPVYEYLPDNSWSPLFDEVFISLDALREKHFPHIEVTNPKHLFLELSGALDHGLLVTLTENYDSVSDMELSINLSLQTVLGVAFANFARRVPHAAREKIGFEIHCGDILQDFSQTLNAAATLRQEGFHIALDGLTPDVLMYFNLARFDVDYIKINVTRDYALSLQSPSIRNAIEQFPKDKLIFSHCDTQTALDAGLEMNVTKFQGWTIDDLARVWRK